MSWLAEYEQYGTWHKMDFGNINVAAQPGGLITAQGSDEVGQFTIEGSFSPVTPEFRFLKQYTGKHAVYYKGTFDRNNFQMTGHYGFEPGDEDGGFRMKRI